MRMHWTGGKAMLESRAFWGRLVDTRRLLNTCGAVAQLGERRVRNAKVEGSIPFRSTIYLSSAVSGSTTKYLSAGFSSDRLTTMYRAVR